MSGTTTESGVAFTPKASNAQSEPDAVEQRLVALRAELRKMHSLTVLGTAAATIAHEFNNLMTPVVGYAKFALGADDVEAMKKALTVTLKHVAIGTAMCNRILGLAADEAPLFKPVSVREVVDEAVASLCRDLSKDGIELSVQVDDDLKVLADGKQIQQVLFNLLLNARQAIGEKSGRITIEASRAEDDTVAVSVRDTGCGVAPDRIDRIFEPFVTTKNGGPSARTGVGLGLALCRDIVEEHRGTIAVESKVQVGTTFTLTLPAAG